MKLQWRKSILTIESYAMTTDLVTLVALMFQALHIIIFIGFPIPAEFYGWLAVFVLPVNSALNPIIYTLTTKLFKQQVN